MQNSPCVGCGVTVPLCPPLGPLLSGAWRTRRRLSTSNASMRETGSFRRRTRREAAMSPSGRSRRCCEQPPNACLGSSPYPCTLGPGQRRRSRAWARGFQCRMRVRKGSQEQAWEWVSAPGARVATALEEGLPIPGCLLGADPGSVSVPWPLLGPPLTPATQPGPSPPPDSPASDSQSHVQLGGQAGLLPPWAQEASAAGLGCFSNNASLPSGLFCSIFSKSAALGRVGFSGHHSQALGHPHQGPQLSRGSPCHMGGLRSRGLGGPHVGSSCGDQGSPWGAPG